MRYVALLRGINVGGNSLIKMADLKNTIEMAGYEDVTTYGQSGNVILESSEKPAEIASRLESVFEKHFGEPVPVVVIPMPGLKSILENVPDEWRKPVDLRMYMAFVHPPESSEDVMKEAQPREGVDQIKKGRGVVYMTTRLSQKSHSGFLRLLGSPIYQSLTIRSYSTVQKTFEMMAFLKK